MKPGVIERRMTGIGIGIAFILMWLLQGWVMRVIVTALGVLAVWEMVTALEHTGAKPMRWVCVGYMALCMPVCHFFFGFTGLFLWTVIAACIGLCATMLLSDVKADAPVPTIFPILYPGAFFGVLLELTYLQPRVQCTVVYCLVYVSAMLNDVAAYEIGTLYGKTPLAPRLSPKKTVEGSLAGIAASILVCALVPAFVRWVCSVLPFMGVWAESTVPSVWICALFGLIGGLASQAGDLCASMIKRHCGIKDYGTIFPGHGGVMDRMDGILFSGVCACVFFVLTMR